MSIGGSLGKSKSKNSSSFNQDVWDPSGIANQNMYGSAAGLANQSFGKGGSGARDQMNQGKQFSQGAMDQMQSSLGNLLEGGAYSNMDISGDLSNSLQQSQNNPSAMQDINSMIMGGSGNNYADAMRNQYQTDANQAMDNMNSNLDMRAANSGMSGSSRHGVAQALGMRDINKNLQSNMANTGYQTFDKDLDRKLSIAQQADQNTFGRQQLMSDMLGNKQNTMNQGFNQGGQMINQGSQQQMMPWQQMSSYSDSIGGPQVLSSGSGSGSSKSMQGSGGKSGS